MCKDIIWRWPASMRSFISNILGRFKRNYTQEPPMIRPTERRKRAAEALRCIYVGHPDYALLKSYVDGMTLEAIAAQYHMSEATVNRRINAMLD